MPMNVKEVDNFFGDQLAIFRPNFVQNCEFRFSSKTPNFVISFVFRPKRISCVFSDRPWTGKPYRYVISHPANSAWPSLRG